MRAVSAKELLTPLALMASGMLLGLSGIIFALFSSVLESVSHEALTMGALGMSAMVLMRSGVHHAVARRGAAEDGEEWAYAVANAFRDVRFWMPAVLVGVLIAVMRHWSLS